MKVLTEGHKYVAANFENKENGQTIQFIEKVPNESGNPGELITVNDGTTNEELLEVIINRTKFLNAKFPCRENALAITDMESARNWFLQRTREREARNAEGKAIS